MATVLVVDDHEASRDFLATLLGYERIRVLQAADGHEAFDLACSERPDLVITDLIMPVMDGYELARRLRGDPATAHIPVIFNSATYLEDEARTLASACGVMAVLVKPVDPERILSTVKEVLKLPKTAIASLAAEGGDAHRALHVYSQKLASKLTELNRLDLKLTNIVQLGLDLAQERELPAMLKAFVHATRGIIGAKYAAIALLDEEGRSFSHFVTSGVDRETTALIGAPPTGRGLLGRVVAERRPIRLRDLAADPRSSGFPPHHPPMRSFLGVPVASRSQWYGTLYLTEKSEAEEFGEEDERLAVMLAFNVGVVYENMRLCADLKRQVRDLECEVGERRKAEQALHETKGRLDGILSSLRDVVWSASGERALYLNPAAEALYGRPVAEFFARPELWLEVIHPEDQARMRSHVGELLSGERSDGTIEYRILCPGGALRWVRDHASVVRGEDGAMLRIDGVTTDITDKKLQEVEILHLNRVYAVLSGINNAIVRTRDRQALLDEACRIAVKEGRFALAWIGLLKADGSGLELSAKHGRDEGLREPSGGSSGDQALCAWPFVAQVLREQKAAVCNDIENDPLVAPQAQEALVRGHRSMMILPLHAAGRIAGVYALYASEKGFFDDKEVRLLTELAGDISYGLENLRKGEELKYLAYYDALTGLPNITLFHDRLGQLLPQAEREQSRAAVILFDIERFRNINDSYGRHIGDALLRGVGERLQGMLGADYDLARVGADCYAAIAREVEEEAELMNFMERGLVSALHVPIQVKDHEFRLAVRIGIAVYPTDGSDAETLFAHAEAALKRAKERGERYLFYAPEMQARVRERFTLETRLRRALDREEFVLHYQPKVNVASGQLTGLEALIRWQDPDSGLVAPDRFIPLLEDTGMIVEVGRWVLFRALKDYKQWQAEGLHPPRIAVNVSAIQLRHKDFVESLRTATTTGNGAMNALDIELTETALMQDLKATLTELKAVRELGIGVAVDDFGTGYCSLKYLSELPVTELKIDRAFVHAMTSNPLSLNLISTIINLGHSFGLKVIAEGVETEEQSKLLGLLRCDELQGYLVSPPAARERIEAYLQTAPAETPLM